MNKCKTTRIILTFLICFNILGLETNFIFSQHETKNNFIFSQPDEKDLIRYGDGSFFIGGNGIATDVINWINISKAIEEHITDLETNTNNERIAIIDTGLDEATWDYYEDLYGDYINLQLIDYDGTNLTNENAIDRGSPHHGSMITSLMIQLLQSYASQEIEAGITMFIGGQYGSPNAITIEDQLQRIIDWNDGHSTGKFKVISMSFFGFYDNWNDYYADEIDTLANDQGCILLSISGNIDKNSQQSPEGAYLYENEKHYPAADNNVFGVGSIYGSAASSSSNEEYKVSLNISETTQELYIGSQYFENQGTSNATVDIVAPGFEILLKCDNNDNGTIGNYTDTGTSYACPQVAVAAYLASRIRYKDKPNSPLTKYEFVACIMYSSENDPSGRTDPGKLQWSKVGEPIDNLGTYTRFYSYRVGYGSLDVGDMLEYITTLS